jgi:hypothetical protein
MRNGNKSGERGGDGMRNGNKGGERGQRWIAREQLKKKKCKGKH